MRGLAVVLTACSVAAQTAEYERARRLLTSGHAAEAVVIYRELSSAHPEDSDTLLNLAIAEYKAGKFREAAASAGATLKLKPDLQAAYLFLGASDLELGDFSGAIDSLQRVIAANPGERNGRLMLAEALLGAGRPEAAVEHLKAAAEMLSDNPRVWYGLGRAYEALGRKDAASAAWERLAALSPSLESHLHAAAVHDAQQRWREAALEFRKALELAPQNKVVRVELASSLFRSRDYNGTIATLKPLLASDEAEVQFLCGASFLNLQQPVDALPYLREAVARDTRLLSARAALGQALLQTGKPEEAAGLLADAISLDDDGSIHFQLFRAYQLTNRKAEAQQALAGYHRLRASLPPPP